MASSKSCVRSAGSANGLSSERLEGADSTVNAAAATSKGSVLALKNIKRKAVKNSANLACSSNTGAHSWTLRARHRGSTGRRLESAKRAGHALGGADLRREETSIARNAKNEDDSEQDSRCDAQTANYSPGDARRGTNQRLEGADSTCTRTRRERQKNKVHAHKECKRSRQRLWTDKLTL